MESIFGVDENRIGNSQEREEPTNKFEITKLNVDSNLKDIKIKSIEIINKNTELIKFQKKLRRDLFCKEEVYREKKEPIEVNLIKANKDKKRNEQYTKEQLSSMVDSQIDIELRKDIRKLRFEIEQCEITGRNHFLVSEQIKNYNISESAWNKYLNSNNVL